MGEISRRRLLQVAGVGMAAGLVPALPVSLKAQEPVGTDGNAEFHGLRVGVATYSLRKFTYDEVLQDMQRLKVHYMSLKDSHLPLSSTPAQIKEARQKATDIGVTITSCGVIYMKDDDKVMTTALDYAQHLGCGTIVVGVNAEMLPRLNRLIKNYDLKVAIHNHGPHDKLFPSPLEVYSAVQPYDRKLGLCMDIGHTFRMGENVAQDIHKTKDRLYSMHFKDVRSNIYNYGVPVGTGLIPEIPIMKALLDIHYKGEVMLEYETDADHPIPGMMESFGYMRGVLQTLA